MVEPLITRSKENSTHNRRVAFAVLRQKEAVTELFAVVAPKVGDRPGGYTRIIRTGNRLGDNAEMCLIELVDFNDLYGQDEKKKTTRRSRRTKATTSEPPADKAVVEEVAEEAPALESKEESAE